MDTCCSRFTAAEGGARLAVAAGEKNILAVEYASFIATRLVHEHAYKIRGLLSSGRQRSVYVTRASRVAFVTYDLQIMTDLKVVQGVRYEAKKWGERLEESEVLVCTSAVLKHILENEILNMAQINVLIIDSCHLVCSDEDLQFIMKLYKQSQEDHRPRILALTYPLFSSPKKINPTDQPNENGDETPSNENGEDGTQLVQNGEDEIRNGEDEVQNGETELRNGEDGVQNEESKDLEIGANENLDDFDMYEKLEWKIEELEKELCCEMDLAEDIDGGKRLAGALSKPKELIIEYSSKVSSEALPDAYKDLDEFMRNAVNDALEFINEHRYDPTEIYGEDLYEEFKNIPDPTIEPKFIFKQFLYVLDQLGPYAADKAAFSLLAKLEKLKIKVPYERHFLLQCLCTTVFIKIRSYADDIFSRYESDWEKIKTFSTPKVLRFAEILQKFQPPEQLRNITENTAKMLSELDKCDFTTLGNKIEDKVNTFEANLKELEDFDVNKSDIAKIECDISNNLDSSGQINSVNTCDSENINSALNKLDIGENRTDSAGNKCDISENKIEVGQRGFGFTRRSGGRPRGRGRVQRNNTARAQQMQLNPDALCGIVFMKEALMAKIMFMLIVDMSRAHPSLAHLCAQYCAVETPADPAAEAKEAQRQSKKQEEVLKKFRMHECNLLLTTSALEEGIDLPRCNLVLRWDVPQSYRSYGLCRGRARASRSSCAVLCADDGRTDELLHNLATYKEIDQIISRKCGCGIQDEPPPSEEDYADTFSLVVKPYTPQETIIKNIKSTKTEFENDKDSESDSKKTVFDSRNINDSRNKVDRRNGFDSSLVDFSNLQISENAKAKAQTDNDKDNTQNHCVNSKEINETASDIKESNICNGTDNLFCNRCNKMKLSVSVECPCSKQSDIAGNKLDSKLEKDGKVGESEIASVDMSSAIALINRYCGKLPSDTFTRLAPQWWMEEVQLPISGSSEMKTAYICTLRLPLNCPVKYNIVGHPMPTRVLARRMVALQACRILHKSGELDNHLMPIGKENFKAAELDASNNFTCFNGDVGELADSARPGTTKRRQYYFKRTAWAFTDCQPVVDATDSEIDPPSEPIPKEPNPEPVKKGTKRNMLYAIVSKLWCALPERYNTRGRRLHAPQNASQAIGILMARDEPDNLQIPSFPVYTRSGEVRVSVEHVPDADVRMSPRRGRLIRRFMRFVFAMVLRVRRRGMRLQSDGATHNNYYIVPTIKSTREDGSTKIDIDWAFLELIYQHTEEKKHLELEKPLVFQQDEEDDDEEIMEKMAKEKSKKDKVKKMENPLLKPGETFVFDAEKYKEAVVTPWYRNQDQPQFFLVAEICWNLSPDSAFPSVAHTSFRQYYTSKYNVCLTQSNQPLLDVDHTSARLNLLTPRYVNRKGVALPVSSERTRRAKRDRLDQKQILVPELCRVHPFAAPLWFATVALPCVLYRINALLIADEIRRAVAIDVGLGIPKIDEKTCPDFQWPPLDFGWSLAEVLSADTEKTEKKKEDEDDSKTENDKETTDYEGSEKEDGDNTPEEPKEKTINDILAEKEDTESGFEIGTWSNDMASSIPDEEYDELLDPLPSNITFCTSASGGTNWCDPIEKRKSQFNPSKTYTMAESDCSYMSSDFDTDDSDLNTDSEDDDTDASGFWSKNAMGVRIEYKTAHEAEAVDLEKKKKTRPQPQPDPVDDQKDREAHKAFIADGEAPEEFIENFRSSVIKYKQEIIKNGNLIKSDQSIVDILPEMRDHKPQTSPLPQTKVMSELFPYGDDALTKTDGQITLESIERNKRILLQKLKNSLPEDEIKKLNCFSMVDVDIDSPNYVNEKIVNVGFDTKEAYAERIGKWEETKRYKPYYQDGRSQGKEFDFDYQPDLEGHPGPSPSVILQALTMSNANDGINLERLETVGDSFLKFAITAYLYCAHPTVHEGKLSHMRSKQVSNLNLYRLGVSRRLGARMIASKFEPHDNWLPPCHRPPHTHNQTSYRNENAEPMAAKSDPPVDSTGCFIPYNLITQHSIPDKSIADCVEALIGAYLLECGPRGALVFMSWLGIRVLPRHDLPLPEGHPHVKAREELAKNPSPATSPKPTPRTANSETECSSDEDEPWLQEEQDELAPAADWSWGSRPVGSLRPYQAHGEWYQPIFGELKAPPSPLLRYIADPEGELEQMLSGYDALEETLQYRFKDRSLLLQAMTHASHQKNRLTDCYQRLEFLGDAILETLQYRFKDRSLLLQAMTHASHQKNRLTDCYQRLEFLGDAILDYLITRHLYEDPRRHSPGALTDLRSALVNNTIFATLAARHGFHKYFRHMSPGLNEVLTKYVKIQEENGHSISEEHYLIQEDEMEQAEDVEVPKALGDLFESVAGAIFLDSGMSLGAVWKSYVNLMGAELEAFSAAAPKSPVRELLEAEPDTAKFGKPERLADGRRVRVCVEVFGRGAFKGVGRNYRIAKGTAARCALRHLRALRPR